MKALSLIKSAGKNWCDNFGSVHCAAIAYYTTFSIAPLAIISIAIAGLAFGQETSRMQIYATVQRLMGPDSAQEVDVMIQSASHNSHSGLLASLVGIAILMVGASGVFRQLQLSLNMIWKVKNNSRGGLRNLVRQSILPFFMVIIIGLVFLISLIVSAVVSAVGKSLNGSLPGGKVVWQLANLFVSLGVNTLLFASILKFLPDVKLAWRDVWVGAALTALLFNFGQILIAAYLGMSSVSSIYGAAGSLIVILIWVYYSAAILLFGTEFTRVYSTQNQRVVPPKQGAEFLEAC